MTHEQVSNAMVASAHLALYEASGHELDATDDELRAAIAAAINASGCVLVPREPTGAMTRAGKQTLKGIPSNEFESIVAELVYKSMIGTATGQGEG